MPSLSPPVASPATLPPFSSVPINAPTNSWEELRRAARNLENEVESKLTVFGRFGVSGASNGFGGFEEVERELEDALARVIIA